MDTKNNTTTPAREERAAASALSASPGSHLYGKCVEYGDDRNGNPHMVISTTREELAKMKDNPLYKTVKVQTRGDGSERCMDVALLIMRGFGVEDKPGFQEEIAYILKREFIF